MRHFLRVPERKKLSFVAGLVVAIGALISGVGITAHRVSAADYSGNAILYGGYSTPANFIQQLRQNNSNGHQDIQTIYKAYGLEPAGYDRFVSYALPGTAYKDGRIVVTNNGHQTVIATGATSIGRQRGPQGPNAFAQNIGGVTYYGNTDNYAFASDALPVYVLFNAQGVMQFAVIQDCGNPMGAKNVVHPGATCDMLNMTKSTTQANTYSFSAKVSETNPSASLFTKYVYDFGDGSSKTTTNPGTVVTHTYSRAGNFKVTVTPYVKLPGNPERPIAVGPCVKTVTVVMPYQSCVGLVPLAVDTSKMNYSFTVKLSYGNGSTPTKAYLTFGDGSSATLTKLATSTTYVTSHPYSAAKTYNIAATVYFNKNGTIVAAPACTAMVSPTAPPVSTCKPGIPVGDVRCNPCLTNPSVPASDTQDCQPPTPPALPNTGAGNTIAIFAAVVIGGFLVYRHIIFRKHKAAFAAAQYGTSPLPLADPLSDNPLADTPLAAPKRRSFRRNRPF